MRMNERTRKWLPWLLLAAAVVAATAVYWPGLTGGWVFDDYPNIVDNAAIHITPGHSTLTAWVNSALSSPSSFLKRPLASLTFSINWYFGGGDPWPFKLTNIVIHLVNGALVFCMLRALLRLVGLRGSGGSQSLDEAAATRLALVVAAAWMLLPINLMAVLYVVQRMESLCQVFVLAGLWAYLHGRWMMLTAADAHRDRRGFALAVGGVALGTVLGLTSKETAVLLPVFAFLVEWVVVGFAGPGAASAPSAGALFGRENDSWALRGGATDSGFRPAAGPGMTKEETNRSGMTKKGANPFGTPLEETSHSSSPLGHYGAARSAEPGIGLAHAEGHAQRESIGLMHAGGDVQRERRGWRESIGTALAGNETARQDKRIWTLFTVTLFVPAVLGFAWLILNALNSAAWSGRDFTLVQRLLTEPRVLVDYLQWTIFPNPMVLSLYHDEIVTSTGLLTPWTTLGAIVLLTALAVVALLLRKRRPLVSLGIGWFFAAQLLTATIIPLELVYEQRMYFASIGVLLAAAALLLGLRWKIALPILRGFVVAVALLWFAAATNLRAREWSNPLRLAVVEANRHPESPRAVYEAGRLLLIASNYQPGQMLDASRKYLREAAAIPGASALPEQAMIMIVDHNQQGADADYWNSMIAKLRDQPTRQEDISALISLTNCYSSGICKFDVSWLQHAYEAALSRPHPIARLDGAYANFQRDILHDDMQAEIYMARAVAGTPGEPAYRVDLAALYARNGQTEQALEQIDALRRMNFAGRLDGQIATLERMAEQGRTPAKGN